MNTMDDSTKERVNLLHLYLENLPNTILHVDSGGKITKSYNFDFFSVDDDDLQDMGHVGAINCQLKICLGHHNS